MRHILEELSLFNLGENVWNVPELITRVSLQTMIRWKVLEVNRVTHLDSVQRLPAAWWKQVLSHEACQPRPLSLTHALWHTLTQRQSDPGTAVSSVMTKRHHCFCLSCLSRLPSEGSSGFCLSILTIFILCVCYCQLCLAYLPACLSVEFPSCLWQTSLMVTILLWYRYFLSVRFVFAPRFACTQNPPLVHSFAGFMAVVGTSVYIKNI